jgi:hypothetical protein
MQFCDGAMKSLRSDACSTGENLLDDIVGRAGGTPIGSRTAWGGLLRLRDYRNQSALGSFGTGGGRRRGCRPPRIAPRRAGGGGCCLADKRGAARRRWCIRRAGGCQSSRHTGGRRRGGEGAVDWFQGRRRGETEREREGFFVLCWASGSSNRAGWSIRSNRPHADTTQERGKVQNGNVGSTGYQSKRELGPCLVGLIWWRTNTVQHCSVLQHFVCT